MVVVFFCVLFFVMVAGQGRAGVYELCSSFFFFSSSFVFFYKKNYLYFPLFWGWFGVNMMPEYLVSWDVGT